MEGGLNLEGEVTEVQRQHGVVWGIVFGITIFGCMLVWSQLIPLSAGPDEPSNFVKSAALIRGEFIGHDADRWLLSVEGWAFDSGSGVKRVIVTANGLIVGESELSFERTDVAEQFSIDPESLVGFSIGVKLPNDDPRTYWVYAELNDGTIVALEIAENGNLVTAPSLTDACVRVFGDDSRVCGSFAGDRKSCFVILVDERGRDPRFEFNFLGVLLCRETGLHTPIEVIHNLALDKHGEVSTERLLSAALAL